MPADAALTATFKFSQFDEDDSGDWSHLLNQATTLAWTINILHEFRELLRHCVTVAYSIENDLDDFQEVPENQWPLCGVSAGSLVISVVSDVPVFWSANSIAILVTVLRIGPGLAGLPQRIRERWYLDAARAEKVRQALEILMAARSEVVEMRRGELTERHLEMVDAEIENNSSWDESMPEAELSSASQCGSDEVDRRQRNDLVSGRLV